LNKKEYSQNRMIKKGIVGIILVVGCLLFTVSCKKRCECALLVRAAATDEVVKTITPVSMEQYQESGRACKNREKELNKSDKLPPIDKLSPIPDTNYYAVLHDPNYYSVYECKTE
jgi:hypothetical protein